MLSWYCVISVFSVLFSSVIVPLTGSVRAVIALLMTFPSPTVAALKRSCTALGSVANAASKVF